MNDHEDNHIPIKSSKADDDDDIIETKEEPECSNIVTKEDLEKIEVVYSVKIKNINNLITNLSNRIKTIEKDLALNELKGKLKKHYEQSGRYK